MLASLLAGLVSGETALAVRRARRSAIAYAVAGFFGLCGVGFLVVALYLWAAVRYGAIEAALAIGGGFLLLAIIVLLVHRLTAGSRRRRAAERRRSDVTALGVAAGLTVLPTLLRGRGGLGLLLAPAAALAAYAIYRENTRKRPGEPPAPE